MNRKEFFRSCAGGFCGCAGGALISAESLCAAETQNPEDWRLRFVHRRYAKLLEILRSRLGEETLKLVLHDMGRQCSTLYEGTILKYKGDFHGFCNELKKSVSGDEVTFDREKGIITVASPERTECFCPLNNHLCTPPLVCDCSLGWQQHTWETLLGQKVRVEMKEAVLRGGKRCVFEIHVPDPAAVA